MNKFSEINYQKDVLDIEIDVISICNYKCKYCCNNRRNKIFLSKEELDIFINHIIKYNKKTTVTILGGEPLLYPYLSYMVEKLTNLDNVLRIEIYTNGSKIIKLKSKKLHIIFSYHVDEFKKDKDKFIFKNLLNYKDQCELAPLIFNYKPENYDEIFDFCNHNNIPIMYEYLRSKNKTFIDKKFYGRRLCYEYNGQKVSLEYIFNNKINNFYHWQCTQSILIIDVKGNVSDCSGKIGNIFDRNFRFKINEIQCNKLGCNTDCFLGTLKCKND